MPDLPRLTPEAEPKDDRGWPVRMVDGERVCAREKCAAGERADLLGPSRPSTEYRIDGYCSCECEYFDELEQEVERLRAENAELETRVTELDSELPKELEERIRSFVPEEMARLRAALSAAREDLQRCTDVAGEALGTDPSLRTADGCVGALALWAGALRDELVAAREDSARLDSGMIRLHGGTHLALDLRAAIDDARAKEGE